MIGLKDVAKASGVSIRTVSRVLNDSGYASDPVRKRVLAAARKLDYRPNRMGKALRTGCSSDIQAFLGSTDELHIMKLQSFEETLRATDFAVHVSFMSEKRSPQTFLSPLPAGAVFFPAMEDSIRENMAYCRSKGIPYVCLDPHEAGASAVHVDREHGVYEAVRYLIAQGRQKIMYIGPAGYDDRSSKNKDSQGMQESGFNACDTRIGSRVDGFRRGMEESGIKADILPMPQDWLGREYEAGREMIARILPLRVDAIQVFSDKMAMGCLAALHERGVCVPDDIAVIGFDDRPFAQLAWPALTTVAQPNREVGKAGAEYLLASIQGNADPKEITIPTKLVIRDSA